MKDILKAAKQFESAAMLYKNSSEEDEEAKIKAALPGAIKQISKEPGFKYEFGTGVPKAMPGFQGLPRYEMWPFGEYDPNQKLGGTVTWGINFYKKVGHPNEAGYHLAMGERMAVIIGVDKFIVNIVSCPPCTPPG